MQERHFINKIHKRLSSDIYKWKINDAYHGGVPDVFYSGPGGHCFVENKYKKELAAKSEDTKLKELKKFSAEDRNQIDSQIPPFDKPEEYYYS